MMELNTQLPWWGIEYTEDGDRHYVIVAAFWKPVEKHPIELLDENGEIDTLLEPGTFRVVTDELTIIQANTWIDALIPVQH